MRTSESSFPPRRWSPRRAGAAILGAALWPGAFASPLGAQIVPIGGEMEITHPDGDSEHSSSLAADRRGGWGVTWAVQGNDFEELDSRMRRVGRNGDFVAGTLREHELSYPDLGLDGEGNGVVVGQRPRPELGGFEIDALCVDPLGRLRGERVRVDAGDISPNTRYPYAARVAVDTDGTFAVVWEEIPRVAGVPDSIFFRRFDADCRPLGDVYSFGGVGEIGRIEPNIAKLGNGGLVLVWLEGEGQELRLKAQLFDGSGGPIAPAFAVTQDALRQWAWPSIAVSASGTFAIVWVAKPASPSSEEVRVRARVFSGDGEPVGGELLLSSPRIADPYISGVTALDDAFVAAWGEVGFVEQGSAIYSRAFEALAPIGTEVLVNASHTDPLGVRIAALGGQEFVVVWDDWAEGTLPPDVVARRFVFLPQTGSCLESSTALCLVGNRFRVTVEWRDFLGRRGAGQTRDLTADSGLFWFFDDANLEVLVKMVDGCAEFSRYWVFAAATTNLEYTLHVTDTATGRSRSYFNRLGVSSPAVTDTDAFATCL